MSDVQLPGCETDAKLQTEIQRLIIGMAKTKNDQASRPDIHRVGYLEIPGRIRLCAGASDAIGYSYLRVGDGQFAARVIIAPDHRPLQRDGSGPPIMQAQKNYACRKHSDANEGPN
jgi:hypothetical protein